MLETGHTSSAAESTTGATLLRSAAWSTASRTVPQLYTLAVSITAARILGSEEFGRQSFIAFAELAVIMLFTGGLPLALMRAVGETLGRGRPGELADLLVWGWRIELGAAALGGGTLTAVAVLGADPASAWALAAVAATLGVLHTVPSAVLIGAQRWRAATSVGLATGVVGTLATIVILALGGGITGMFAVEAVVSALNLGIMQFLARRAVRELGPTRVRVDSLVRRQATRFALIASIEVVLSFVVWRRSEFFFLERFSTETEIAFYSIAFAVVAALTRLPEAFAAVLAPAVATLHGAAETERIQRGFGRALRLLLLLTLPLAAASAALLPETLRVVYGDEYRAVGDVALVMVVALPLIALVNLSTAFLQGVGRIALVLAAVSVAAVVDIGLALALVSPYGAIGAAIANTVAQATAAVIIVTLAARAVGGMRWEVGTLVRAGLASGTGGGAAVLVVQLLGGVSGIALGAVCGLACFLLAARLLRIVAADDTDWLEQSVGRRFGAAVGRAARQFGRPRTRIASKLEP